MKNLKLKAQDVHAACLKAFLLNYCQGLSFANSAMGALRARNWTKLVEIAEHIDEELLCLGTWAGEGETVVYHPFSPDEFKIRAQFVAMLTKYPYEPDQIPGLDPDMKAVMEFLSDEKRNRRLNTVLRGYRVRGLDRHPAIAVAREWILRVMGKTPDLDRILSGCDFSGGASINVHGNATHFGNKVAKPLSCTPAALEYFTLAVLKNEQLHLHYSALARDELAEKQPPSQFVCLLDYEELLEYLREKVDYQQDDFLSCVPKKYNRARTIGTPQTANTFLQKGVDVEMRRRLKDRANLDLSYQGENQLMAREGAAANDDDIPYVTLDVKSASNSVLIEVVRTLYSEDWFNLLNVMRSPGCVLPDGSLHRYELFVSMGNGFCFPLETSIFAALCVAACKTCGAPVDFRVYGDDIIVRQDVALVLYEILRSCGFRLNLSKSFIHGPFRESCGANWHGDRDVTPVYWRRAITSRVELHAIHNAHKDHPEIQEVLRGFDPGLPFTVPDTTAFSWISNEAFRVSNDVCMAGGAIWRRDTQSFRYRLLITHTVYDEAVPQDETWERLRYISALRGTTFEGAFPLRKSVRYVSESPRPDTPECKFSGVRRLRKLQAYWKKHAEHEVAFVGPRLQQPHPWVEASLRGCLRERRLMDNLQPRIP